MNDLQLNLWLQGRVGRVHVTQLQDDVHVVSGQGSGVRVRGRAVAKSAQRRLTPKSYLVSANDQSLDYDVELLVINQYVQTNQVFWFRFD